MYKNLKFTNIIHNTYYQLFAQCLYLLLIIALTCLGHSSWPLLGSLQVYPHVQLMCQLMWQRFCT